MMLLRNFKRFFGKAVRQPAYAVSVFRKRLAAQMSYYAADGKSSPPEAITLFLTHRCNLQCKMCGQWGEGGVTKRQGAQFAADELPLENVKKLLDEVAGFRPNITLFGGEPFLHKSIIDIIKHVKSKGMHCLVITNGFLLKEMAEDIAASGLDELNVSLDGDADLHDNIRGMEGLFEKISSGLMRLQEIKHLNQAKKPLVNLQCTITRYNFQYLERMLDVAKRVGADSLTFHNLIFVSKELLASQRPYDMTLGCSSRDWEGFEFDPGIDPDALYGKMKSISSGRYPFSVDFYPNFSLDGLRRYYDDRLAFGGKPAPELPRRCLSPWIAAYIFPDGEVRPCLNSDYSYGNIKDAPFKAIWNGEKAVRFRRILKKSGAFPLCRRCTELYRY